MIITCFAVPGAGKTTYATSIVVKERKKKKGYKSVLTNFPVFGALNVEEPRDLGKYNIEDSLIIIDEAGVIFNNRDWKLTTREFIEYLKMHRHYTTDIMFISQTYDDMDVKIRDISDKFLLLNKVGPFTIVRSIKKRVGIDPDTHQVVDMYMFNFPTTWKLVYRPKYYKYFNSWDRKPLPPYDYKPWQVPLVPVTLTDKLKNKLGFYRKQHAYYQSIKQTLSID